MKGHGVEGLMVLKFRISESLGLRASGLRVFTVCRVSGLGLMSLRPKLETLRKCIIVLAT